MKSHKDFAVIECVVQTYQHEPQQKHPGKWFWHCFTCDTGSGRRTRHLGGHKLEGDAKVAAKYHKNQKRANRQWDAWYKWWNEELMTTTDVDYFKALWQRRFGPFRLREDMNWEQAMGRIQGKIPWDDDDPVQKQTDKVMALADNL